MRNTKSRFKRTHTMRKKRYQLAIHTVFLPRENLFFLKEWLAYHLHLGVEHFYLYDNSGSIGRGGSTSQINKRRFNFHSMTSGLDDIEVQAVLEAILDEFGSDICTLIDWQPENNEGQINYGQAKSVCHCMSNYRVDVQWLATIDMDEYLFCPEGDRLGVLLTNLCDGGYSRAVVLQKKFADRYLHLDKLVTDIEDCIEGIDTSTLGPKNIFLTDSFDECAQLNIHNIPILTGDTYYFDPNTLRFNHYNVCDWSLNWMQRFYQLDYSLSLNAKDNGMKRYRDVVYSACRAFGTPEWRRSIVELDL